MLLPGGLVVAGERRRQFAFRPVDGRVEMEIAAASITRGTAAAVTAVLAAALERLGDEEPTPARVRDLCVGDRQFLVRQLAAHLGRDGAWLATSCAVCRESFDIHVEQSAMPVKEAGAGFPFGEAGTSRGTIRVRVPSGGDQEAVADLEEREALRALTLRCIADAGAPDSAALSPSDLAAIDAAIEAAAPETAVAAAAVCPRCGHAIEVEVSPYLDLADGPDELLAEVHVLASSYHWSEHEILALTRERRHAYLRLVERDRGIAS